MSDVAAIECQEPTDLADRFFVALNNVAGDAFFDNLGNGPISESEAHPSMASIALGMATR